MVDSPRDQEEQNHDTEQPQALPTGKAKAMQAKRRGASQPPDFDGFPMVDSPIEEQNTNRTHSQPQAQATGKGKTNHVKRRGARCPQCGKFVWISLGRRKPAPHPGNWRIGWVNGSLQVGKVGVPGWLGPWRKIVGTTGGIVPPESVLGAAVLRLKGVLRRNGFYVLGENGRYRRAGKGDLRPSTALGRRRLVAAGWLER